MAKDRNRGIKLLASTIIWGLFLSLAITGIKFHVLQDIESKTWDWRIRLIAKTTTPDPKIKIIMIDQDSIDRFAQEEKIYWPWPRSVYAPVLTFLKVAGAKGIAFDMLFTEQQTQVEDDQILAEAISANIPVVSSLALNSRAMSQPEPVVVGALKALQERQASFAEKYLSSRAIRSFEGATVPIVEILRTSAAVGTVNEDFDSDRIFRRVSAGGMFKGIPVLTLPFAFYHLLDPKADIRGYLSSVEDGAGKFLIKFRGPARTYPWYTIDSIISSSIAIQEGKTPLVDPKEFKDAFVFLGPSASALLDLRPCPFPGLFPGVEVHATTFDNLLNRDFLREATFFEASLLTAIGLLLIVITSMYFVRFQIPALVAICLLWIAVCFQLGLGGVWVPLVVPLVAMVLATIASVTFQYQLEGKQYKFIRGAFQYYVTAEVIDAIVEDPSTLTLGGERRELTILFSDIEKFTSISESMEPAKLVQFLNKFLSEMTDIILATGGTIDKYEGDAIIAFWNAPLPVVDHQARGIGAAIECQRRLRALAAHFLETYGVSIRMRVGLNTGAVTVGNFGSSTRFNYTMIGDAANLASRLEGVNKVFGTTILVSEGTMKGAEGARVTEALKWRKLGEIKVVGKEQTVSVWEPLHPELSSYIINNLSVYQEALGSFERGDRDKALALFGCLAEGDPASAAYVARINEEQGAPASTHIWILNNK